MGGDIEELVAYVEDAFGVSLRAAGLDESSRFDDLASRLAAQLRGLDGGRCFSNAAFWRLRRALTACLGLPKRTLTPSTELDTLLPVKNRRRNWRAVADRSGLRLPKLEYPGWVVVAALAAAGIPAVSIAVWDSALWLLAALPAPLLWMGLLRLARPLAAKFPLQCRTLGEAAKAAAALNDPALSAELGAAHERGIREALRYAIADATGTDADLLERENPLLIDIADGGFRLGA